MLTTRETDDGASRRRLGVRGSAAVGLGRAASWLSRTAGRGDGAIIGGRIALALDRDVLRDLAAGRQVVLVTGTNGKTTTTHMISAALRCQFGRVASNHTGANMPDGHTAALAGDLEARYAVLEVDELHLEVVAAQVRPAVIVLLNLSRDQLDRAEEVRRVADRLAGAVRANPDAVVVANADDPNVVVAASAAQRVVWVGAGASWRADATCCPLCTELLVVDGEQWWCPCGFRRPEPAWSVHGDAVAGPDGVSRALDLRLPGAANRGNAVMALAAVQPLGGDVDRVLPALRDLSHVHGRYREVQLGGRAARLLLAKNPAGWQEMLTVVADHDRPLVIVVNAREADGMDMSWLWDVPFELLRGRKVIASGERATDLAVRLRYAEVDHLRTPDPVAAVAAAPAEPEVIANYTAFRALLGGGCT